jgi:Transposase zinc-ribbon domain
VPWRGKLTRLYQPNAAALVLLRDPRDDELGNTREERMDGVARDILAGITTVRDMVEAFQDEDRCRRLLEAMIWPRGRLCPACGYIEVDGSCWT